MAERVAADHPSVRTFRATVERSGATSRHRVQLPADAAADVPDGVVRVDLDGSRYHADVRAGRDGQGPVVRGAYDTARLARSPGEGPNRLAEWLDDVGLGSGRSVLVDVVVGGYLYGLRPPGTSRVYEAVEPPSDSLADIAEGLDG